MFILIGLFITIFCFGALALKNKDMLIEFFKESDKDTIAFSILILAIGFCIALIVWPTVAIATAIYLFIKRRK